MFPTQSVKIHIDSPGQPGREEKKMKEKGSKDQELARVEVRRLHERYLKHCQGNRSRARLAKYWERRQAMGVQV